MIPGIVARSSTDIACESGCRVPQATDAGIRATDRLRFAHLALEFVIDNPLPWQPAQEELTPERVQQGLGGLFQLISTPASPPKARGKSPGWPKGKPRTRRERHKVVKKTKKKAKAA